METVVGVLVVLVLWMWFKQARFRRQVTERFDRLPEKFRELTAQEQLDHLEANREQLVEDGTKRILAGKGLWW